MTLFNQRAEVPDEQRAKQRRDVQAIGVGIRQNTNLAVAQLAQVVAIRIDTDGDGNIMHFWEASTSSEETSSVQDFTFQRHDRLILAIARLLGRSARRIPFHKEQFGSVQIWAVQSASLPGSAGPLVSFLRTTFFAARRRRWALEIAISASSSAD